jgi:hypothetical protein
LLKTTQVNPPPTATPANDATSTVIMSLIAVVI